MAELTETDRRILAALTEDARMPVKVLADRLDLSRTTVATRLDGGTRVLARLPLEPAIQSGSVSQMTARTHSPSHQTALNTQTPSGL